jgi:nicotinamide riboside transporter PnuC
MHHRTLVTSHDESLGCPSGRLSIAVAVPHVCKRFTGRAMLTSLILNVLQMMCVWCWQQNRSRTCNSTLRAVLYLALRAVRWLLHILLSYLLPASHTHLSPSAVGAELLRGGFEGLYLVYSLVVTKSLRQCWLLEVVENVLHEVLATKCLATATDGCAWLSKCSNVVHLSPPAS